MRRTMILMAAILGLIVTPFAASQGAYTIWHSPLTGVSDDPRLTIDYSLPGTGLHVTTNSPGDLQWVTIALTIPSNVEIEGVVVCYELASAQSFISQVRLTRMTTPDYALVIHDDPTDLTDPGPTCYLSNVYSAPVEGTISLAFRLNFTSAQHWVDIGAIGIVVEPIVSAVGEDDLIGRLTELSLSPNQPNPFGSHTAIEYALESADHVDLEILDVSGRVVRSLFEGHQPMGEFRVIWDGRDDAGLELESGAYYYHVRIGDRAGSRGMVMLR